MNSGASGAPEINFAVDTTNLENMYFEAVEFTICGNYFVVRHLQVHLCVFAMRCASSEAQKHGRALLKLKRMIFPFFMAIVGEGDKQINCDF